MSFEDNVNYKNIQNMSKNFYRKFIKKAMRDFVKEIEDSVFDPSIINTDQFKKDVLESTKVSSIINRSPFYPMLISPVDLFNILEKFEANIVSIFAKTCDQYLENKLIDNTDNTDDTGNTECEAFTLFGVYNFEK